MNRIERTTEIIGRFLKDFNNESNEYPITLLAKQINQLYGPQPDQTEIVSMPERYGKIRDGRVLGDNKPDQSSRLLTEAEVQRGYHSACDICEKHPTGQSGDSLRCRVGTCMKSEGTLCEAQDAKTARSFEDRIEALIEEIESKFIGLTGEAYTDWQWNKYAAIKQIDWKKLKATHCKGKE